MRDIRVENVGFLVGAAGRAALSAGCAAVASAAGGDDSPSFGFCDSREVDESVALGRGLGLGSAFDGVRERAIIAHGPREARDRSLSALAAILRLPDGDASQCGAERPWHYSVNRLKLSTEYLNAVTPCSDSVTAREFVPRDA